MTNPLSLLIALIMLCTPVWILYDLLKQKATLFEFYQKFEALLKKKQYAIPSILLIVANWGWNIYKDL